MKRQLIYCFFILTFLFASINSVNATTWAKTDVKCPVCNEVNIFSTVASFGSYIYDWPEKYQYIFWPLTDSQVMYSCTKCHFTTYMWDFKNIDKNKIKDIKALLTDHKFSISTITKYDDIPVTERLLLAEKIYKLLNKNDDFWCRFYRVMGYHFEIAGKHQEADEFRKKALTIADEMIKKDENAGISKELLLIKGGMKYFLKDEAGALTDLEEASKLKYENKDINKEDSKNIDEYLTQLLGKYIKKIKDPKNFKESD